MIVALFEIMRDYAQANNLNRDLILEDEEGNSFSCDNIEECKNEINSIDLIYNTEPIIGYKPEIGDLLIYKFPDDKGHIIIVYDKTEVVEGISYRYNLAEGYEEGETGTSREIGWVNENPGSIRYSLYEKYFSILGEYGEHLYEYKPHKWDFSKVLRIKGLA